MEGHNFVGWLTTITEHLLNICTTNSLEMSTFIAICCKEESKK